MQQLRAVAIANRHFADLIRETAPEEALKQINFGIGAAARAEQRDILHLANVSKARILLDLPTVANLAEAQSLVDEAHRYAETMGLYGLAADARIAQAYIMIRRGDMSHAGLVAAEAVGISVRHGLRLRKIGGLLAFAETREALGHSHLALSVLQEAKLQSESLGYLSRAAAAANLIAKISIRPASS